MSSTSLTDSPPQRTDQHTVGARRRLGGRLIKAATRIWLDVPYAQKDQAKALGARWDPEVKRWYAPRPNMTSLQPWTALPDVPDLLPGEDRSFGSGLFVDLVPSSCWFTNVRSCVDQKDWDRLRRMITRRAGHRCEVCGASEDRQTSRWLEAHERWAYDEATHVQSLRRLVCLCTNCHTATHFGLAQIKGNEAAALALRPRPKQPTAPRSQADSYTPHAPAPVRHRGRS